MAVARLRRTGQRYTGGRRELLELLSKVSTPLTIPEILAHRRDLAQSSVYRNLTVLEQAGLVQRIVTSDEWARFELAEDLTEHHHHLICSACGSVRDFTLKPRLERSIDDALNSIADGSEFVLHSHRLDLVGLCRDCAG